MVNGPLAGSCHTMAMVDSLGNQLGALREVVTVDRIGHEEEIRVVHGERLEALRGQQFLFFEASGEEERCEDI
jgi:hypothetical protein